MNLARNAWRLFFSGVLCVGAVGAGAATLTSNAAPAQLLFATAALTSNDPLMGDGDAFGDSLAISGDIMAVGAPGATPAIAPTGSEHQGAVYVLQRPSGGPAPKPRHRPADGIGRHDWQLQRPPRHSVAIDADTIVVGASGTYVNGQSYQGAVYVFTEPNGGWASETRQPSSPPPTEHVRLARRFGCDLKQLVGRRGTGRECQQPAGRGCGVRVHGADRRVGE